MKRVVEFRETEDCLGLGVKCYAALGKTWSKKFIEAHTEPYEEPEEPHKYRVGDVFSTGFNRYVITAYDGDDVYIMYDDGICGHTIEERIEEDDCLMGHVNMPALFEFMKIMEGENENE